MTVSDESAGSSPTRKRKPQTTLTKAQWKQARIQYETTEITYDGLANIYGCCSSTFRHKGAEENWAKQSLIVKTARDELHNATMVAVKEQLAPKANEIATKLLDDLQPWIEKEKRSYIKKAVARSKRFLGHIDRDTKDKLSVAFKDHSFIAKTVETHDTVIRRNLGLGDGKQPGGSLSLRILTGQTAVELTT